MPRRYTVLDIVGRCRARCDEIGVDSGPIDDNGWAQFASEQYGDTYSVVAHSGMEYFEYTSSITTDGGFVYDEVADHLSTVNLSYVDSSGQRRDLEEVMAQERSRLAGRTGDYATSFALVDDKIYLYPTPPAGQTYELRYIAQPPELTIRNFDETLMVVDVVTPDGLAMMVWGTLVKAASALEFDPTLAISEREAARQRLEEWAALRAFNQPRRPQSDFPEFREPHPDDWRFR